MNHTIVKIKTRERDNKYRKLFSNQKLYELPEDLKNTVEFIPDHNLDEECWFCINQFSGQDYCIPLLTRDFTSTSYELLEKNKFSDIEYLCYIEENIFFFQKVSPTNLVKKKKIILSETVTFKQECQEIAVHKIPDAIYIQENDKLYFKNLNSICSIFKGIDMLYREATEEETCNFLDSDFIELDNFSAENVKKANRKRIALVTELMKHMKRKKKKIIMDSIKDYCPQLVSEEGRFRISSERDLKLLLYGIDQRFYTTPDGEEKRIANSIIRMA